MKLFLLFLLRKVVPDDTPGSRADHGMMAGDVTRYRPNRCALGTALCLGTIRAIGAPGNRLPYLCDSPCDRQDDARVKKHVYLVPAVATE